MKKPENKPRIEPRPAGVHAASDPIKPPADPATGRPGLPSPTPGAATKPPTAPPPVRPASTPAPARPPAPVPAAVRPPTVPPPAAPRPAPVVAAPRPLEPPLPAPLPTPPVPVTPLATLGLGTGLPAVPGNGPETPAAPATPPLAPGELRPNPVELPAPINPEGGRKQSVEMHRNLFCEHYDECLDEAVKRGWNSFTCLRCGYYGTSPEGQGGVERYATQRRVS